MYSTTNQSAQPIILIDDESHDRRMLPHIPVKREREEGRAVKFERPTGFRGSTLYRQVKELGTNSSQATVIDLEHDVGDPATKIIKNELNPEKAESDFYLRCDQALRGHRPIAGRRFARPVAHHSANGTKDAVPRRPTGNGVAKRDRRPASAGSARRENPFPAVRDQILPNMTEPRRFSEQEDFIIFSALMPVMSCQYRYFQAAADKLEGRSAGDVYSRFRTMKQKLLKAGLPWLESGIRG
ncbi:hypothetical protein BC938DRAFT_472039 [Jimgerdemannia flammicorona]|nr:hypothetical protein BC938DRAFT_472039 [Jimgerdemannia flammicorona]